MQRRTRWGILAERGIDLVLQSQYTGHAAGTQFAGVPGGVLGRNYYPGLALYNWSTGALQPRSVVNQVILLDLTISTDMYKKCMHGLISYSFFAFVLRARS